MPLLKSISENTFINITQPEGLWQFSMNRICWDGKSHLTSSYIILKNKLGELNLFFFFNLVNNRFPIWTSKNSLFFSCFQPYTPRLGWKFLSNGKRTKILKIIMLKAKDVLFLLNQKRKSHFRLNWNLVF